MAEPDHPWWLFRIETLGTTVVVLLIGGMALWFKAAEHSVRVTSAIVSGLLIYVVALVGLGRRSNPASIAGWPFALAGLAAGLTAELINAQLLLTREAAAAAFTGMVIGSAHWLALRVWLRVTQGQADVSSRP